MDWARAFWIMSERLFVKLHLLPARDDCLDLGSSGSRWRNLHLGGAAEIGTYLVLGPNSELTIASGSITVTGSSHKIDTEADAATDDLTTILGGPGTGALLILRSASTARDVVVKAGTGNLIMDGDFTLATINDRIMFVQAGTNWYEISRSDNS